MFDNMQDQDDEEDGENEGGLHGPTEFVLDDCPFGSGVMGLVKSMSLGELCKASLGPQHVPGEGGTEGGACDDSLGYHLAGSALMSGIC